MSALDKVWHVYIGSSWVGTLTPTGSDDEWYYADFAAGDAWGNFAPWFQSAYECYRGGDEVGWHNWFAQLTAMGLTLSADDGEAYRNPTLHIDGTRAWFIF